MATYKVISDRLTGSKKGETLDERSLTGANIQALIEAGHLEPAPVTKKQEDSVKTEDSKEK